MRVRDVLLGTDPPGRDRQTAGPGQVVRHFAFELLRGRRIEPPRDGRCSFRVWHVSESTTGPGRFSRPAPSAGPVPSTQ